MRAIAAALRTVLDEPAEDGVGGWDEAREAEEDEATAFGVSSRLARLAFSNASSSSSSSSSDASDTDASARARRARAKARRAYLLGGDANSNVVGTANAFSRRGVAGRGGGGVARASAPSVGPAPARRRRCPGGGWDAGCAARLAAMLHGAYGWDVTPCVRLAADVLGWEGASPEAAAAAAAAARAPDVGWNAERAAVLVAALAEGAANDNVDEASLDGAWDVPGFIAPMADALVGEHDWSPLETAALLEHLQAWTAEDAAALALGLSNWADAGVAALLGALMEWRRRDRAEVAHVVRALISRPPGSGGEWQGGGALGKLLGVREGEARAAAAAAKGDGADGEAALFAKSAAGLTISSRGRVRRDPRDPRGGGGGGGDALLPHAFPSEPIQFGREREAGAETIGDGYSADAD